MDLPVGSLIEVSLRILLDSQVVMNVWQYEIAVAPNLADASEISEAWWNHTKGAYRALCQVTTGRVFDSVIVRELNNPAGGLAEYSIPPGESDGTRPVGSLGSMLAGFNAVGVRLSVGSRATRPGQKRVPFATEGDVAGPHVQAPFAGLVSSLMDTMTADLLLGEPAEFVVLNPIVTRKDATGAVLAHQSVTGYVVNNILTTQVSRRIGRGM